jgi:heme/copper-type cytochrome/quinol oxidase subunit 1
MMPTVSIWMIRAALSWMIVGGSIGLTLMLAQIPSLEWAYPFLYQPPHGAIMMLGWVIQLAMGVGYWMLPRYITPEGDHLRGSPQGMWICAGLLNTSVLGFLINPLLKEPLEMINYPLLLISMVLFASINFRRLNRSAHRDSGS